MELWTCTYLRTTLRTLGHDTEVGNKEPATLKNPLARPLIIVRDDSGARGSAVTFDRSLGVSVLAGTRQNDRPANDLARLVYAVLTDEDIALVEGSPIAAVVWDGCNGPYPVEEDHDVARRYMTIQYTAVGAW
jgi:hypothetical protein